MPPLILSFPSKASDISKIEYFHMYKILFSILLQIDISCRDVYVKIEIHLYLGDERSDIR